MMYKAVFETGLICMTVCVEIPCAVVNCCSDVKMNFTENLNRMSERVFQL